MKEIGGFFELNVWQGAEYYTNAVRLNTARNCLRYLIRALRLRRVSMPAYTCPVVWKAARDEQCEMDFYNIDANFMPDKPLDPEQFLIYTNYFGVCTRQTRQLFKQYPHMISDNSQAFFSPDITGYSFNSPRKFFGVPDGAYLFTKIRMETDLEQDVSFNRMSHLLKRFDLGANTAYEDFKNNDTSLSEEAVKRMSRLTQALLHGVDYSAVAECRRNNFLFLHKHLAKSNCIQLYLEDEEVPMVYPFLTINRTLRKRLTENRIYVACYWNGQRDSGFGRQLESDLLPLPIDQRYSQADMERILEVLNA